MKVACSMCGAPGLNSRDKEEVPVVYNIGDGVCYVGACCYEGFNFSALVARRETELRAEHRAARERAKGA